MKKVILERFKNALMSRVSAKTITGGNGEETIDGGDGSTCGCPAGMHETGCIGGILYCSMGNNSTITIPCPVCNI